MERAGKAYSLSQLAARVQRWQRLLPDLDVGRVASRDVAILDADISAALRAVVVLVEVFPGRDVVAIVSKAPRLLWCDDLVARCVCARGRPWHWTGW